MNTFLTFVSIERRPFYICQIAETVWRKLKKEWLNPEDYLEKDKLYYAANRCLAALGKQSCIRFSPFNGNLF